MSCNTSTSVCVSIASAWFTETPAFRCSTLVSISSKNRRVHYYTDSRLLHRFPLVTFPSCSFVASTPYQLADRVSRRAQQLRPAIILIMGGAYPRAGRRVYRLGYTTLRIPKAEKNREHLPEWRQPTRVGLRVQNRNGLTSSAIFHLPCFPRRPVTTAETWGRWGCILPA